MTMPLGTAPLARRLALMAAPVAIGVLVLAVWEAVAGGFKPAAKAAKAFGSQRFEDD